MKKVNLGIIGCGIAANEIHYPALQKLQDKFEIGMVCNHTEPKAKKFAHKVGDVPYVLEYQKLLNNSNIDAVVITLPIELNRQVAFDAIAAGKHVMVEKPVAKNIEEAEQMVELESETSLVTMTAENYRYRPVYQKAKQIINEKIIGRISVVMWNIYFLMDINNKFARTKWRINHQYPGGFITDGGVHNIAALREIFGYVQPITGLTKSINPKLGQIDTFSGQFKLGESSLGLLNMSYSTPDYNRNELIIYGEKGSIVIDDNHLELKKNGNSELEIDFEDDYGYRREYEDFYDAIIADKGVRSTFLEGKRDLEVLIKALKISRSIQ